MTDAEKQAMALGQKSNASNTKPSAQITPYTAEQIQELSRDRVEALSDCATKQIASAVSKRTSEKLAYHMVQDMPNILQEAEDIVADFLPKIFANSMLLVENQLDILTCELEVTLQLTQA